MSATKVEAARITGAFKCMDGRPASGARMMIAAACIAALFPLLYFQGAGGSRVGRGHSFILLLPRTGKGSAYFGSIDGLALLAILTGIALVAWFSILLSKADD